MKKLIKSIPNIISYLEIPFGIIATIYIIKGEFVVSSIFIGLGIFCDLMDGTIARLLNAESDFGKKFVESLTDSFLIFPPILGLVIYNIIPITYLILVSILSLILLLFAEFIKINPKIKALSSLSLILGYIALVVSIFMYLLPINLKFFFILIFVLVGLTRTNRIKSIKKEFLEKWQGISL